MKRPDLFRKSMSALLHSGAHRLIEPFSRGAGLIFMLHNVRPARPKPFAPNRFLEVTPEFLDGVLGQTREEGLDIVTLGEAAMRLRTGQGGRFACFTLDDGYRDNAEYALPIFRKHEAPFAVYVPTDFPDGRGELWWLALEAAIENTDEIVVPWSDGEIRYAATTEQKWTCFEQIYWRLRTMPENEQRATVRKIASRYGVDLEAMCRDLIMDWDALRDFASDPLVTIGAHTAGHYAVAKLTRDEATRQMAESADTLEAELGMRPRHLSYPYGDAGSAGARDFSIAKDLGFETAVTTRKGMLYPEHRDHLTALPRVSLNGDYQSLDFTRLYLGGAPFALWNRFRRIDTN